MPHAYPHLNRLKLTKPDSGQSIYNHYASNKVVKNTKVTESAYYLPRQRPVHFRTGTNKAFGGRDEQQPDSGEERYGR